MQEKKQGDDLPEPSDDQVSQSDEKQPSTQATESPQHETNEPTTDSVTSEAADATNPPVNDDQGANHAPGTHIAPDSQPAAQNPEASPAPAPAAGQTAVNQPVEQKSRAGHYVLQWLTYAFWFWTIFVLALLIGTVLSSLFEGTNSGDFAVYVTASLIVLLPISYVCDMYYSRIEERQKHGATAVIMLLHAVVFGLITVGSAITVMFLLVSYLTTSDGSEGRSVALLTAVLVTLLYGYVFLRTLNPSRFDYLSRHYRKVMLGFSILVILGAAAGPVAAGVRSRDDRLKAAGVSQLSRNINNYALTNERLPNSLNELELDGDAQLVVEKDFVVYKDLGVYRSDISRESSLPDQVWEPTSYKYELCVEYKAESEGYSSRYRDRDEYQTYASTYSHPEGEVCYKLRTSEF